MISLRVEELIKEFQHGSPVVNRINFTVPEGQLFTLLGPSGCGKTTTLRIVAGLEEPTSGRIWFGDQDCTHLAPHRRGIGMVFQSYALFPHLTIFENVAYPLRLRSVGGQEIKTRVSEALDLVGLGHVADRKPQQLSGGQQQRVALARALVYRPKILLMDEPLSNLDAKLRVQMREEIRAIQRQAGITALYVTHDQEEALAISDQMAVMHDGNISQLDNPQVVYERPADAKVADFVGRANFLAATVVSADKAGARVQIGDGHLHVTPDGVGRLKAGEEALLFFRPEKGGISAEPLATGSVPCRVTRITYLGESVHYNLQVNGIAARVTANRLIPGIAADQTAHLTLPPEDILLYPHDPAFLRTGEGKQ